MLAINKNYLFVISVFMSLVILLVIFSQSNINWDTWRIATCMPDECFCEAIRTNETIRQPSNTWSSMAFTLIGLFLAGHALSQSDR